MIKKSLLFLCYTAFLQEGNMKEKSNQQLLTQLKKLRQNERETLASILTHLEEVEKRRAYAALGFSNIFKYLTRELGYSDSAAARRIQALKLVKRAPETKKMIEAGELNLTSAGLVNKFLDNNGDKGAVKEFKNKTVADCNALLGDAGIIEPKREVKRRVSTDEMRVTLNLKKSTYEKFEKLKGLLKKNDSDSLLDEICDIALNRQMEKNLKINKSSGSNNRSYFPAAVKKKALRRADFTCEFENCDEMRGLELDHITPKALGGSNTLQNCRVLCKNS